MVASCLGALWKTALTACGTRDKSLLVGEQMFITDISSDYGEQSQITELEHVAAKSSKQFG